jgi:hypothetical protein
VKHFGSNVENELPQDFVAALHSLVDKECWGFSAGPGTGSMVVLDFGKKVPRTRVLANPHLTEDQKRFKGEVSLFLQGAAWRLNSQTAIICGSTDSNEPDGPMLQGLGGLVSTKARAVDLMSRFLDLLIEFEGGIFLTVFCDQTNIDDQCDNYSLHVKGKVFAVATRSKLIVETAS